MTSRIQMLLASQVITWLVHLGGPGLILLGIADSSVVPMPGSMDALTIWLAASNRDLWFYYAAMAVAGSVSGGYMTYALARKGGKEAFERKFSKKKANKVFRTFERWGFWAVTMAALLPPPFPTVPFLLAAGALQYSRKKFLTALAIGRGIRFLVVAGLGAIYEDAIVRFFSEYYEPALFTLIGMAIIAGIFALIQYIQYRKRHHQLAGQAPDHQAA